MDRDEDVRKIPFSVDAGLILELGRKLISKDETALMELVKNCYDADATDVYVSINEKMIRVCDNGMGMDEESVKDKWMRIGTISKRQNPTTPEGRHVLGSKGIGRLSAFRLGKNVEMVTKTGKAPAVAIRLRMPGPSDTGSVQMDLDEFVGEESAGDSIEPAFPDLSDSGTCITVTDLYMKPGRAAGFRENMKNELMKIVRLTKSDNIPFHIHIGEQSDTVEIIEPDGGALPPSNYSAEIKVGVDTDHQDRPGMYAVGEFRYILKNGQNSAKPVELQLQKPEEDAYVGPFVLRLSIWDLDSIDRTQRSDLKGNAGISVIRNGFMTVSPSVDWLGLNLRRVNLPTVRLSTNQVQGEVMINSEMNPGIEEKTDRQGFIENEAFQLFRDRILAVLGEIEKIRFDLRLKAKPGRGNILREFDTTRLREVAKSLEQPYRKEVLDQSDRFDEGKILFEDLLLGRDRMAAVGILAARLTHETRNAVSQIHNYSSALKRHLSGWEADDTSQARIREELGNLIRAADYVIEIIGGITPFIKFRSKKILDGELNGVQKVIDWLYSADIRKYDITIEWKFEPDIKVPLDRTDLYLMVANLVDNAVYWVKAAKRRYITVGGSIAEGKINLYVDDSGPGVNTDIEQRIFETGYSEKPDGTGLGLAIVRDIVASYDGEVLLAESSENGGARFEISIPVGLKK